jgi:hypothetical protein
MKTRLNRGLTDKERLEVWNSYTEEQQKILKRLIEVFAPGTLYKIEKW